MSEPRKSRLEVEEIGDVTVVNFVDRKILDEQNIQIIGEQLFELVDVQGRKKICLLYTSPSPRDLSTSRMPSSA